MKGVNLLRSILGSIAAGIKFLRRWPILSPLLFFLVLFSCFWIWISIFHDADDPALIVIEGRSEVLTMTASDGDRMDFRVRNANVNIDDEITECVGEVSIQPAQGAEVTFERLSRGPLLVQIESSAPAGDVDPNEAADSLDITEPNYWQIDGNEARPFESGLVELRYDPEDRDECSSDREHVFILAGQATVGDELSDPTTHRPLVLLSGTATIYGRAAAHVLVLPLNWGPMEPNALFKADEIELPAGTQVGISAGPMREQSTYAAGILSVDLSESGEPGFRFELSANARALDLFLPVAPWVTENGDRLLSRGADQFLFARGVHALDDPNIGWLAWISGGIFFVMLTFLGIVGPIIANRRRRKDGN